MLPGSVVRWQLVTQVGDRAELHARGLPPQFDHLALQPIDLGLMTCDQAVQLIEQVIGEARLHLELGQASFDAVVIRLHAGL